LSTGAPSGSTSDVPPASPAGVPDIPSEEAIPLAEQDPSSQYQPSPEVEALTPIAPEVLPPGTLPAETPSTSIDGPMVVVPAPPGSPEGIGGILLSPDVSLSDPAIRNVMDEFAGSPQLRPSSREIFKPQPEDTPNEALLKQFVTSQRLRDLWHQIDALQEEVIQNVRSDRNSTDIYQQDLLYSSSLLLQSAANYDEARQIVYRIRGDLARERRVVTDIKKYRTKLTLYYAVWFVLVVMVSRFDPQFRALIPDTLPILKLAFPPVLFAILGALFNGIMALISHTTVRRDFDPLYVSWYLINPLLGGLLGLVVFVFFVVTGTSFTPNLPTDPNAATTQAPLVIWLLAFIVGWQQNTAVALLNGFLKTVSPTAVEDKSIDSRPTTPASPPPSSGAKG
jgi:hypothetical protein